MRLLVNGATYDVEVEPRRLLVHVIRDTLGLTGTKIGCEVGKCGACTISVDGKTMKSCMMFGVQAEGSEVWTIEGLSSSDQLMSVIQRAFNARHALQCGYCTPGMLLSAHSLLSRNPNPTDREIREAMSGNLCTCTGYVNILEAIKAASTALKTGSKV